MGYKSKMVKTKKHSNVLICLVAMVVLFSVFFTNKSLHSRQLAEPTPLDETSSKEYVQIDPNVPFMPQMTNETLKAELGNAAWKLFHTILARYPDEPTSEQQTHLINYITSFAQVYPCGDCARHFAKLLEKYPPQTKSRKTAAVWGCHVHNKVNEHLKKPDYDCSHILEDYDCGCGEDEVKADKTLGGKSLKAASESKEHLKSIKVELKEGLQAGG
ncbi:unnamed protein product [Kuraishia capsulata CBS 1993]|uniref:Sulfhydryl oxidase n=1 Tax=Kuraishia capsulata CBS 1993 TaxID=1382522 RepID=W6MMY5_9ASCO|nr:uncharacterized protein KUCA_T00002339001 [Kuraishia capsulata CBS 1993]CDK26367.1 unnamed protein product [Kuraishia capsulata CBS 1993]